MTLLEEEDSSEFVVQSEMIPKIREFHTSESSQLTTKLLHAKRQDGRPAFNPIDLSRLSISSSNVEDEQNIRYFLQNVKSLEELHLSVRDFWTLVGPNGESYMGLHDILSPSARTLKVLDLTGDLYCDEVFLVPSGLCEELEAMAGHYNVLETLSYKVHLLGGDTTENFIRSIILNMEEVLVKPGWSALKQASFEFSLEYWGRMNFTKLSEALQIPPDQYQQYFNTSKLEFVSKPSHVVKYKFKSD